MANELRRNSLLKESACFADHTSPASLWPEEQPDSQASSGSACIKPGCQCPRPQSPSPPLLQNALSSPVSKIQVYLGRKTFKASPPAKWCGKSNGSKTFEREEMKEVKSQREREGLPHQGGEVFPTLLRLLPDPEPLKGTENMAEPPLKDWSDRTAARSLPASVIQGTVRAELSKRHPLGGSHSNGLLFLF